MVPYAVPLAALNAVQFMSVIVEVIAAADVDSFVAQRTVVESDAVTVAVMISLTVHRSTVESDSVAVLLSESGTSGDTTYPMA